MGNRKIIFLEKHLKRLQPLEFTKTLRFNKNIIEQFFSQTPYHPSSEIQYNNGGLQVKELEDTESL